MRSDNAQRILPVASFSSQANIKLKNVFDVVFGALAHYLLGYVISYGTPSNPFILPAGGPGPGGFGCDRLVAGVRLALLLRPGGAGRPRMAQSPRGVARVRRGGGEGRRRVPAQHPGSDPVDEVHGSSGIIGDCRERTAGATTDVSEVVQAPSKAEAHCFTG